MVFRSFFDTERLLRMLDEHPINGQQFCEMGRRNWVIMLKQNSVVGKIGVMYKLWSVIHQFNLIINQNYQYI